jgi:tRNA pseudouridine38-40 synthase
MNKYKINLEYDGSNYRGWQSQKNAKSVQGTLIDTVNEIYPGLCDKPGALSASGRTDAGVHALGQVIHLSSESTIKVPEFIDNLNSKLPSDIHILKMESMELSFHARHHAVSRSYLYLISQNKSVFSRKYVWNINEKLDIDIMKKALEVFNGFHDFISFGDKRIDKKASTKVDITNVEIKEINQLIAIRITGSHFLWKMVRRMVGITVAAARGQFSIEQIEQMLKTKVDMPAKHTAYAQALFLESVRYKGDKLLEMQIPQFIY